MRITFGLINYFNFSRLSCVLQYALLSLVSPAKTSSVVTELWEEQYKVSWFSFCTDGSQKCSEVCRNWVSPLPEKYFLHQRKTGCL